MARARESKPDAKCERQSTPLAFGTRHHKVQKLVS
jgi:hypothetical protein